jgi:hypothetical protein
MNPVIDSILTNLLQVYAGIPETVSTEEVLAAVAEFSATVDAAEATDHAV